MEGFDMGGLRHSEMVERINLPDEATIQAEKTHVQHLATIGAFDQASLTPVKVMEPLTGPEVSKLEKAREGISSELATFDKADLKETEVEEKMVLPGKEDIAQERGHLEHMAGLEAGLELRKTETREPASPLDLAKLELHKDQVEEELQAFDRCVIRTLLLFYFSYGSLINTAHCTVGLLPMVIYHAKRHITGCFIFYMNSYPL